MTKEKSTKKTQEIVSEFVHTFKGGKKAQKKKDAIKHPPVLEIHNLSISQACLLV